MQLLFRSAFTLLLVAPMDRAAWAAEDPTLAPAPKPVTYSKRPLSPTEYKRADQNAYPKAELLKARPGAVIIPQGKYEERDGSYFFTPKVRAPKELFFETSSDWIEPITPPDMPASLGIATDAMQIREPQGDVQVALPSAPGNFSPATENMVLPNGSVIKTGVNGTAAVLFGGVDSARLMPNSAAAVQQTVTAQSRAVEVDLTSGGVFSKVGTQVGVKGTYQVHTSFGNAVAEGGDFVTILGSDRTDVLIASGSISLADSSGTKIGDMMSDGKGELKILRTSPIADAKAELQADSASLTAALDFIPLANQKLKKLRDKLATSATLTANETAYLGRIKQVPYLMMLDVVPPPAPVVAAPPAPAPATAEATPPAAPASTSVKKPASPRPIKVTVHADGSVHFHGQDMDMPAFELKLADMTKTPTDQLFLVSAAADVPPAKVQAIVDGIHSANFTNVSTKILPPKAPPAVPAAAATPASAAASSATAETEMPKPRMSAPTLSGERIIPIDINMHADGKMVMEGEPVTLDELKTKLTNVAATIPNQTVAIRVDGNAVTDDTKKVLAVCHQLKLKARVVMKPNVPPMEAGDANTLSLPAPGLRMNPSMQISSDPLPATPTKPEAASASP